MNRLLRKSSTVSFKIYLFAGLLLFLVNVAQAQTVTTPTVTAITPTTATLGGNITVGPVSHHGTRWHTATPVGANNELEVADAATGVFTQARSSLPPATLIYFTAIARLDPGTAVASTEGSFFTEPTQLTGGQFTVAATSDAAITLNFPSADSWDTGGGGTGGYVIFRKAGSAPSLGALADGAIPPADAVGDKITTITNGAATSFNNNTGLSAETDYYYTIVPFVWDGSTAATYNYNTASPQTVNDFTFSTEPASHPASFTATAVSSSEIDLVAISASSGDGYIILRREDGSDPDVTGITDGVAPGSLTLPAGTTMAGTSTSTTFNNNTGLVAATRYRYLIIPYNANAGTAAGTYNYKIDGSPAAAQNDWTFATEPSGHATPPITATAFSSTQINLSFNSVTASAITNATGYILLVKSSAIVAGDLAALADGDVPTGFGLFEAEINSTATNTYSDMGLTPSTTYHYAIIPYNRISNDQTYNFLITAGFATGSTTTLAPQITGVPLGAGTNGVPALPGGAVLSAGTTGNILTGFSVTSTGSQTITAINFNYTPGASITDEYLYRNANPTGLTGATLVDNDNSPDGNFTGITEAITGTTVYYYLVVDVVNSVNTSTTGLTVATNPTAVGVSVNTGTVNTFYLDRSYTFISSRLSDITLNGGTTADIDYISFRSGTMADNGSNSVSIAILKIRDGGASNDPDNQITRLNNLTISLTNFAMVKKIALYDGGNELVGSEKTVSTGSINWDLSATPLDAADNNDNDFTVRVTFQNTVTDNQTVHVTVTAAGFAAGTSGFALGTAGGATSSGVASPANQIEVNASALAFTANPPNTPINTNFSLTVQARDAQSNIDLDYAGQITLTATVGPGTLSLDATPPPESLTPTLVAGVYPWTKLRINQSGVYTLTASDAAFDDILGNGVGSVTINSSASTITQGTLPAPPLCYGSAFQTLSNILIQETDPAGISGSNGTYTFSIALPSGFVFDPTVTTGVSTSGGADITIPAAPHYTYLSSNTIVQFSYNLAGTANTNLITISGLKVGYPHPGTQSPAPTGSQDITRSGGTATIAGVSVGADLGTVSASLQGPAISFTVDELPGDVAVDPATTNFNANGNAVKLVPSSTPTAVFTGSGVTFVNPDYRFNPSSLSPGAYPITYTYTAGGGCQVVKINTFTVFASGINNLNPTYCTNAAPSGAFSVDPTFINQRMAGDINVGPWFVDYYVYYDNAISNFRPIVSPANNQFDPGLAAYQPIVQWFSGQIPIGFAVCNGGTVPCGVNGNYGVFNTYQWVTVKTAPTVNFTLPSNIYSYCEDNVPVTLTGAPPNSNNIGNDLFSASGGQGLSISHSLVAGNEVWVFTPAAVSGVTPSTSQTFNITYQFTAPSTGCANTFSRSVTVHARPSEVPANNITKTGPANPAATTTIQLCAGGTIAQWGTTDATYNYRWYSDPPIPGNLKGIGPTFTPSVNNSIAATTPFHVTRERNGCESITNPLELFVNVVAAPVAPSPNFSNSIRQYCVAAAINDTHLEVPGTNVKWYNSLNALVYSGSTPTAGNLSLSTASANVYTFSVTQTEVVNGCEGPGASVTVTVKALPIIQITSNAADVNKICTTNPADGVTGGIVKFSAFDNADFGNPAQNGTWSGTGLAGTLNPFPTLGTVNLDPLTLASGPYTLNYNFTNSANCSNSGFIDFTIAPKITPDISIAPICDESPAIIVNTSTVASTIKFAEWIFGDGTNIGPGLYGSTIDGVVNTSGTYESPQHIYNGIGTFQVSGYLTTFDGCRYYVPNEPANVSALPVANFTSTNVCVNSQTSFNASQTTPGLTIQSYAWDFALDDVLAAGTAVSSGPGNTASYTYAVTGKDTVRLVVTTSANCRDTVKKPIFIVPNYSPITSNNSYAQDFTVNDGWISGGVNSSWEIGVPVAPTPTPVTGNAWDTNIGGYHNPNESSWVMSGCFDFTSSTKPVISIDIWSDVPNGVDGAVLQYNLTGDIEDNTGVNDPDPDGDWVSVGDVGSGINWYNENGISNSPGNQTTVSEGWTGEYANWRKAIYKLDAVKGLQKVVFRVAFASSPTPRGEGFTFDNIFIGERSRVVLFENFTNSAATPKIHNDFFKDNGNVATGEIVKIQYNTAFPGADPINKLNQQMHNARTAFYGITEVPTARLDGDFRNGVLGNWYDAIYDDRVLTPAALRMNISAVKVGSVVKINTSIENTTSQAISMAGAHLFTVIVQKSIIDPALLSTSGNTEFVYVAKQMLPTPAGVNLSPAPATPTLLAAGAFYTGLTDITWDDPNGDAIVVFIQSINGNNKNVYQAHYLDNPPLPDVITSIEDPGYAEKINLYPNPANHEINVELPGAVVKNTPVRMFDTNGKVVYENNFAPGERSKSIHTSELIGGVYVIQLGTPDGKTARRKIMVIHR